MYYGIKPFAMEEKAGYMQGIVYFTCLQYMLCKYKLTVLVYIWPALNMLKLSIDVFILYYVAKN